MRDAKVWFMVLAAIAVWVLLQQAPGTAERDGGTATTEPRQSGAAIARVLEDRTFGSYSDCDHAAEVAVQDLKDKGVSVALASQSPMVESTVYKVYYRDATGQISCRGGRLVNEIVKQN